MTGEELVAEHKAITDKMHQVCKAKNADYAGQGGNRDAFANLSMIEVASHGAIKAEHGFLTRMSDKWSRLLSLLTSGREAQVKDESIEDTLLDLANYCLLLAIYLRSKRKSILTRFDRIVCANMSCQKVLNDGSQSAFFKWQSINGWVYCNSDCGIANAETEAKTLVKDFKSS